MQSQPLLSGCKQGFPVNSSGLCLDLGRASSRIPELGDQDSVLVRSSQDIFGEDILSDFSSSIGTC